MRCLACKYDLRSLVEHRCPECGRAFDPNDPATFYTTRNPWRPSRWFMLGVLTLAMTFGVSLYEAVNRPMPRVNIGTGVRIAVVPRTLTSCVGDAIAMTLVRLPLYAALMFIGYVCLSVVMEQATFVYRCLRRVEPREE